MLRNLLLFAALLALAAIVIPLFFPGFLFSGEVDHDLAKKQQQQQQRKPQPQKKTATATGKLFTADELKRYDGAPGSQGLYLAILGEVFDVEKGRKFYEPGASYGMLTAKDASRAFLTGDFGAEGLRDDVLDFSPQTLKGLKEWVDLYHKDYKYVGKLVGRYYSEDGSPTKYLKDVKKGIAEGFRLEKSSDEEKVRFPPCNSEWSRDTGSRVWCTTGSGGIQRKWAGVPRQMFNKKDGGTTCVCASPEEVGNLLLKEYPDCAPDSTSCAVPK